jgi:flagellar FliL protein
MNANWLGKQTKAILWVASVCFIFPLLSYGADEEIEEDDAEAVKTANTTYIPLAPPFVVNYGGAGRLKYLKAEISVRVEDLENADAVRHHMPLIRNNLVMLFSRQTEEDVKTQEGKERLRKAALAEINALITAEDGKSNVVDLFFNNLIIQQ